MGMFDSFYCIGSCPWCNKFLETEGIIKNYVFEGIDQELMNKIYEAKPDE